jgi:signal transduction histidine kinase
MKLSVCYNKYHRSGNQDAENFYDEWVNFSTAFTGAVITYARCLFPDTMLDQIGGLLPIAVQMDTGILRSETADEEAQRRQENAAARKRQRLEQRSHRLRSPSSTGSGVSSISGHANRATLAEAFKEGLIRQYELTMKYIDTQNQMTALRMMLESGSPEDKERAMTKLRQISNL